MERLSSAVRGFAIVPSDSAGQDFSAIYVGIGGAISIVGTDGNAFTMVGVLAGAWIPIAGTRVNATGTTALSIIGLK